MEARYRLQYDDPYAVLAHAIIGSYSPIDVVRALTDNEYLLGCVTREIRQQDYGGHYVDCIIEDLLARKKRMEWLHQLDGLALYLYKNLDRKRLRAEIAGALSEMGIDVSQLPGASRSHGSTTDPPSAS